MGNLERDPACNFRFGLVMQDGTEVSLTWDARVPIIGIVAHSACTATEIAVYATMWHIRYSKL